MDWTETAQTCANYMCLQSTVKRPSLCGSAVVNEAFCYIREFELFVSWSNW